MSYPTVFLRTILSSSERKWPASTTITPSAAVPNCRLKRPSLRTLGFALLILVCFIACDVDELGTSVDVPVQEIFGTGGQNSQQTLEKPYLILVGIDGFRHDYFEHFETPTFDQIASAGAKAEALIPPFPSLTFPSFYSIATGLYPGNHGIVGNRFLDPDQNKLYSYRSPETVRDGTWYGGEPIWVTAETQGMVSAAFFFPATEADIKKIRPTFWTVYDTSVRNEDRVDQILEWLELPSLQRPHLITVYFSAVDSAGHRFGSNSLQVAEAIGTIDRMLARLLTDIRNLPHGDRVYLVIVSDHGMATLTPDSYLPLPKEVDLEGIRSVKLGPHLSLFTKGETARAKRLRDELNDSLRHGKAYLRDELPSFLHTENNPQIGDVVVVADDGYDIGSGQQGADFRKGAHGWDPTMSSMHGIFLAMGPDIRSAVHWPAFESIHVYPFLARLLELQPNPEIDGDVLVLADLTDATQVR